MLDTRSLVLFAIFIKYIATEYTFSSNGWVPIVSDQIYNPNTKEWTGNDVNLPLKSHIVASNVIKISKAPTNQEKESNTYKDVDIVDNSIFSHDSNAKINDPRAYEYNKHADNTTKLPRTAKQINEILTDKNIEVTNVENIKKNKDVIEENDNKISATWQRSNTYEVEEAIDSLEAEDNNSKEVIGYDYTPPVKNNQSFRSTLMNILSKYNIKTDDTLKNYDLSRQAKSQSGVPNFSRILHSYRYNSLNHLPVDPLLAIFLSNYGFYFPNLYGIKSNYNNLYGYLASNNIHNNRPFGLYKIFSDTDSWN